MPKSKLYLMCGQKYCKLNGINLNVIKFANLYVSNNLKLYAINEIYC